MLLSQFKQQIEHDVSDFAVQWLEGNVTNPVEWPLEMGDSDWMEHFIQFLEERHGR